MNLIRTLFLSMLFILIVSGSVFSQQGQGQGNEDFLPPIEDELIDEEDEEAAYDDEEGAIDNMREDLPDFVEEEEEGEYSKDIIIDMRVVFDYVFEEGGAFDIVYTAHLEGTASSKVSVISGEADVTAKINGPLAKWPTGECNLEVTIPKIPFDITYRKTGDDKARIILRFKKAIMESWSSKCLFNDTPGAKFITSGPPEKWFNQAIQKASPPLRALSAKLDPENETTSTSTIKAFTAQDQPLGHAQIEGTIVTTIKPK